MSGFSSAPHMPGATIPKLRSSCDSCGSAKIKCDRARPQCRRCAASGLRCIYGVSRKFGRPPRRRLHAEIKSSDVIEGSGGKESLWPDPGFGDFGSVDLQQHQEVSAEVSSALPNPRIEALPTGIGIDAPPQRIYDHDQMGLALFNPLVGDEWPQFDIWMPTPSPKNSDAEGLGHKGQSTQEAHNCARESYEILADLICPAPDLHAPGSNSATVTAKLDQVLHFNRKAIDRLSRLLECSCAKSGHRVMVHAAIISRILIWYQQAAGWTCSSPEPRLVGALDNTGHIYGSTSASPSSDGIADIRTPTLHTLPKTTGFVVADVPAALGTFSIEDRKMQTAIRKHLVLTELNKMSSLIDLFGSHFSDESSVTGVASLCSYTAAWLQNEYSRTMRDLTGERPALRTVIDI
ncbi:hypothetical protein PV11_02816 [Exophiala sideris]|uniref:Zn(2)-C6 fungal-type domain-containing protein n=1 Tax=Exophiala sideris TaxID=1016849 RepID=A0A0D1XGH2_9EURO|nr:hypothetical protein PV11_02816 [Exophiala sideris]